MTRRRNLSPEEAALWRKVTRDVARYRSQKPQTQKIVSTPQEQRRAPLKRRANPLAAHEPAGVRSPSANDLSSAGDPRLDRLAGRGRIEIDAVLDLHGHTQVTARRVLHQFIAEGYARGARCLLVVTGIGGGVNKTSATIGKGILRASFSDWINEDQIRPYVSRTARAHQRHGGAGAFYVFLKK